MSARDKLIDSVKKYICFNISLSIKFVSTFKVEEPSSKELRGTGINKIFAAVRKLKMTDRRTGKEWLKKQFSCF